MGLVLIPEEMFDQCLDLCNKRLINAICPDCRGGMCGVQPYPYAYDTDKEKVVYAVKCEQCGKVSFVTVNFKDHKGLKESFFVVAIGSDGVITAPEYYCRKHNDKEDAIRAAEEFAWQLSGCHDTIMVYVLGGFFENEEGNFVDVELRQVFVTCNVEYTQPPLHIIEKMTEEEKRQYKNV